MRDPDVQLACRTQAQPAQPAPQLLPQGQPPPQHQQHVQQHAPRPPATGYSSEPWHTAPPLAPRLPQHALRPSGDSRQHDFLLNPPRRRASCGAQQDARSPPASTPQSRIPSLPCQIAVWGDSPICSKLFSLLRAAVSLRLLAFGHFIKIDRQHNPGTEEKKSQRKKNAPNKHLSPGPSSARRVRSRHFFAARASGIASNQLHPALLC